MATVYEKLSTLTGVDVAGKLTLGFAQLDFAAVQRQDDIYAYDDREAGEFGDYSHKFAFKASAADTNACVLLWGVSSAAAAYADLTAGQVVLFHNPGTGTVVKLHDLGTDNSDAVAISLNTEYHVQVARAGAAATLTVYSDAFITEVGSVAIVCEATAYRYWLAFASEHQPGETPAATGYVKNFLLFPVSAVDRIAGPQKRLRTLLASSATFQALVGAASAQAARASIHVEAIEAFDGTPITKPYALVMGCSDYESETVTGSGPFGFQDRGLLRVRLVADVPSDYADSPRDAGLRFKNVLGRIITEMIKLSGSGTGVDTYLRAKRFAYEWPPKRTKRDDTGQGDCFRVQLFVGFDGA